MNSKALYSRPAIRFPYQAALRASKLISRRGLSAYCHREFSKIPTRSRVLSVGAGGTINTLLLKYAEQNGFGVTQVDINPDRHPDKVEDICHWRQEEAFDVVVLCEVLEHVVSPQQALENIHASLKPGGKLLLTIPFLFPIHEEPHDYTRFTIYGLKHHLRGFSSVEIEPSTGWSETLLVLMVRTVRSPNLALVMASPLFIALAFVLYPFSRLVDTLLPSSTITARYLAVAHK